MIWYPDDVHRRPLQVSFYIVRYDNGNFERIHETRVIAHLDELRTFVEPTIVPGEGAVIFEVSLSMTYQGQELLGIDGAIEATGRIRGPNTRSGDGEPISVLYGDGIRYEFDSQGETFRYRYTVGRRPIHDLVLPGAETKLEWELMNRRIERIKSELGDPRELSVAETDLKRVDHDGLIAYTLTAPLDQLLAHPRPEHIANRL